jgi:hypothetical protein
MKNSANIQHTFVNVPTIKIPRSQFNLSQRNLTAFDNGELIPVYCEPVVPGDTFKISSSISARLATMIYPIMDTIYLDLHWFFVPDRLVWTNFDKFHGAEVDPGDSNDYLIPTLDVSATPAIAEESIFDQFGLPTGTTDTTTIISAIPFRGYNLIYNEFFRDQNLIDSVTVNKDDGPDALTDYSILNRGAKSDYYTSLLPAPYKSDDGAVSLPLGTSAPIKADGTAGSDYVTVLDDGDTERGLKSSGANDEIFIDSGSPQASNTPLFADLSTATASTVDQLIEAFALQELFRIDSRSGTRAFEIVQAHFGVMSPSLSHQYRPEFLGLNSTIVGVNSVPQTSATSGSNYQGDLSAFGTASIAGQHSLIKSFTEWGHVFCIASTRTDRTYQQGIPRKFLLQDRYDMYLPALSNLGEEPVTMQEIYWQGNSNPTEDIEVLGYQERWSWMRTGRNQCNSVMRSTHSTPLDAWHLGLEFSSKPTLNQTYIEEQGPIDRVIANTSEPHFIADFYFNVEATRPLPRYSVPGMKGIL